MVFSALAHALVALASPCPVQGHVAPNDAFDFPAVRWHQADARGTPTLTEDALYSGGHGLFLLDRTTGEVLAAIERTEQTESTVPNYVGRPVVSGHGVIARRVDGSVAAFDRALERQLWEWRGPELAWAHPGVRVGSAYVLSDRGGLVALEIHSGLVLWERRVSGIIEMTPAASHGLVFAGTSSGNFHAFDAATGQLEWTAEGFGPFRWSDPVVANGIVYVGDRGLDRGTQRAPFNTSVVDLPGSRSGALLAFDAWSGRLEWGRTFGATGLSRPFVGESFVLAGFGRSVARFDLATGEIDEASLIRTNPNAFGSPTVLGERIYFGNLDGHLYVHRLDSGSREWAFHVPEAQVQGFVHTGASIFVSTTRGLFALEPGEPGESSSGGSTLVWQ